MAAAVAFRPNDERCLAMRVGYDCVEADVPGVWKVQFPSPSPFATPLTAQELSELCGQFDQVLLLGVFGWSNWSRDVVRGIQDNAPWFANNRIGLAICCLENPEQVEQLCPGFLNRYMRSKTEPAMISLANGEIKKARFGPTDIGSVREWITAP